MTEYISKQTHDSMLDLGNITTQFVKKMKAVQTLDSDQLTDCKLILGNIITVWWAIVDSNHRPQSYQDCALTN